jgi:hypothetical protein
MGFLYPFENANLFQHTDGLGSSLTMMWISCLLACEFSMRSIRWEQNGGPVKLDCAGRTECAHVCSTDVTSPSLSVLRAEPHTSTSGVNCPSSFRYPQHITSQAAAPPTPTSSNKLEVFQNSTIIFINYMLSGYRLAFEKNILCIIDEDFEYCVPIDPVVFSTQFCIM